MKPKVDSPTNTDRAILCAESELQRIRSDYYDEAAVCDRHERRLAHAARIEAEQQRIAEMENQRSIADAITSIAQSARDHVRTEQYGELRRWLRR